MYLLKLHHTTLFQLLLFDSHSTMYLLKRFTECRFRIDFTAFTFHHVSIKTHCICCFAHSISDSHSTMYLLKLQLVILLLISLYDSHSTMYLLKRTQQTKMLSVGRDSHSTMYLLKPVASSSISYTS